MARKSLKIPAGVNADLYREYITLADRADKRLERLEKLEVKEPDIYGNVTAYAYRSAAKAIEHWDKESGKKYKKTRFSHGHPTSDIAIKLKMKDIQAFLDMKTSTKEGIRDVYINRAASLNKKFTTNFTWQEWARFGIREYWDRKDRKFTYNEMIKVASVQKNRSGAVKHYEELKGKYDKFGNKARSYKSMAAQARRLIKGDNLMKQIQEELNYQEASDLLSADINLVEDAINTIFTPKKSIVMQETEKNLAKSGLSYDTMFK